MSVMTEERLAAIEAAVKRIPSNQPYSDGSIESVCFVFDAAPDLVAEVRRLRTLTVGMADRVAAQSELLGKRAEKQIEEAKCP